MTIAVQIGDAEITPRETVPGGRLQVLFMAYSPRDMLRVEPRACGDGGLGIRPDPIGDEELVEDARRDDRDDGPERVDGLTRRRVESDR